MTCTATHTSTTLDSYEEPVLGKASGSTFTAVENARKRRRHSSYQPRTWSTETDDIQYLVDRFLAELGKRLELVESYGHLKLDSGIERAYNTLHAVHESCTHVSDEMIDAGRKRAKVMVDTLEEQYRGAVARKETLEQKVRDGVRFMETMLVDFEARAYAMRDAGIGATASDMIDSGRKTLDEGMTLAAEYVDSGIDKARRAKDYTKDVLKTKIDHAVKRAKEHGLITYQDLPDPWKVNPHILRGYRFSETKLDCVRSLLTISNEFFNIWSHLIGLVIVLSIAFYFYPSSPHFSLSTKSDIFVAGIFFIAACKCLVCSTMWHTMSSISSQTLMERFACVDYTGISLLVAASIMTTEYTAFYCEPVSRWIYMLTTAALGIGGVILPWHPTFNRIDMAWARVAFYVSLSATGAIPVAQLIYSRGLYTTLLFYAPIAKSLIVYLVGAFLYAMKVPERWFPGCFDYVGGSHNIWHMAVLGGILFHYSAMQSFFGEAFRRAQGGECSVY
ncbi:inc metabolism membrane protein [Zalaria obscura]|uniref:Inc metabolism membrane protein n=1 Tax=Zalaria obscura TaxID=2024903 RepID=A0ACC3SB41_9PEZI